MTPFFIALQFLTRLKIVNQTEWSVEDFGKSVVAFPYVGLIIGLILALLYGITIYTVSTIDVNPCYSGILNYRWSPC